MADFTVVLLSHGYPSVQREREIIEAGGGRFIDADRLPEAEALRWCETADAVLVRWLRVTADMLQRWRRCRIIIRYGVGVDNVDVPAATDAGILVGHVPDYCIDDVSTHALALFLACVRQVPATHGRLQSGSWEPNPPQRLFRTAGRTFGLVGLGNIGQAVARKLNGWGMRLLATDPYVEAERAQALGVELVGLEELLGRADYLSLHCPLLPETRHLIDQRALALSKRGLILINTARGPVVDTPALLQALDQGHVEAAGLDVFEEEPLPADSPLRTHPRVVLSDHLAWYSEESQAELRATVAEEAVRVCRGELPRSLANPEVLRRLGRFEEWAPNATARWQLKRLERLKALSQTAT
jgi:D-3-phosphoglycerate dehydrogenase